MYGNKKIDNFRKKLEKVKRANECVVVSTNESGLDTTRSVYIDYIGERWAKGHSIVYTNHGVEEVPETINYADIINVGLGLGLEVMFPTDTEDGE